MLRAMWISLSISTIMLVGYATSVPLLEVVQNLYEKQPGKFMPSAHKIQHRDSAGNNVDMSVVNPHTECMVICQGTAGCVSVNVKEISPTQFECITNSNDNDGDLTDVAPENTYWSKK